MTKQDLRSGMVVECRCGNVYQVFRNIEKIGGFDTDVIVNVNENTWIGFGDINEDLTVNFDNKFDIMKVYTSPTIATRTKPNNYKRWHCIFEREEPKELTVSEIEKLLGYPVKIIAEKEEVKYKVGDKVVTTVGTTELGLKLFPVGTVATITKIEDGSFKLYKLEANNDFWYYKEDMFKRVKE